MIIDRWDIDARSRGLEIVYGMVGALIISAIAVCYLLLRDGAYHLLVRVINLAMLPMGV